jgi:hypothetical protein
MLADIGGGEASAVLSMFLSLCVERGLAGGGVEGTFMSVPTVSASALAIVQRLNRVEADCCMRVNDDRRRKV